MKEKEINLIIGRTETEELLFNINSIGNLFVCGGSGSGKSVWMNEVIKTFDIESNEQIVKVCYINHWGKNFLPIDKKYLFNENSVADCREEVDRFLDDILIEIYRRRKVKVNFPNILIFGDGVCVGDFTLAKLYKVLTYGKDIGVFVIISSQSAYWMSDKMLDCFDSRILFWHYDKESANKAIKLENKVQIKPWRYVFQDRQGKKYFCKPISINL